METVRAERLKGRIRALERQVHKLDMDIENHRKWSHPWMRCRMAKKRLTADIATLKIMLETLEPGGDASA